MIKYTVQQFYGPFRTTAAELRKLPDGTVITWQYDDGRGIRVDEHCCDPGWNEMFAAETAASLRRKRTLAVQIFTPEVA